jgi:hypothetical protein
MFVVTSPLRLKTSGFSLVQFSGPSRNQVEMARNSSATLLPPGLKKDVTVGVIFPYALVTVGPSSFMSGIPIFRDITQGNFRDTNEASFNRLSRSCYFALFESST